ncbi:FprA family A-type flavoprotein [Desulfuromonas sp. CSMB_57]|uniref:FprA family A-type flavoprotein n=1 Tax=Desulfuromonas sp. CSMB_57 TaxID=2807629 RepID=UPI001CD79F7B|nr:FprA family A-type flavoprotein [Desulfuromonas sp. CSMB_57]
MNASRVADGIFRLSANIGSEILFEGMWLLPHGASMNSYLVKGEQAAIIDGVCDWDGVPETLYAQLDEVGMNVSDIRYVIINHTEPDHTGWLRSFSALTGDFEVLITARGLELAKAFYDLEVPFRVVKSGDSVDLGGGRQLVFEEIPNVHWPDTMVTFEPATGTLFSCDAFGTFGAINGAPYDEQLDEMQLRFFEKEALRYYANIVARFSQPTLAAIAKVRKLPVRIIAPGHGPVWRRNPEFIIDLYERLAGYGKGPAKPKVTLLWGSMYGNTEKTVAPLLEGLAAEGVESAVHQVPQTHIGTILASAWESTGIALAMPTYEYQMFPPMAAVLDELGRKQVRNKLALRVGSFGWSGGAQRELEEIVARQKMHWQFLEPVEFRGAPAAEELELIRRRARELARQVKAAALA